MKIKNAFFTFALIVIAVPAVAAAPVNDFWESATLMTGLPTTASGDNDLATTQPCEQLHQFYEQAAVPARSSVWFKWQVPASGSYTVKLVNSQFNAVLSAWRLATGPCNGAPAIIPYRAYESRLYNGIFGTGELPQVSFRALQGETIHFSVDSLFAGLTGQFTIALEKTKYSYDAQMEYSNGGADLVVHSLTDSNWWILRDDAFQEPAVSSVHSFGRPGDRRFLADFNGDAVSDFAIARPENGTLTWWIADKFGTLLTLTQFGLGTDRPVVGDYDGDGLADIVVTRNESGTKMWHILRSSDRQYEVVQYGLQFDKEMVGDYDGDRQTGFAVLRVNQNLVYTWYIRLSSTGSVVSRQFGVAGNDIPQAADFDGDGKTDITIFRQGTWYSLDSSSAMPLEQRPTRIVQFGTAGDKPQAADYDGDRKSDYAVFRGGVWWVRRSRDGQVRNYNFGVGNFVPMSDGGVQNAFVNY
jgi:FG-GAP-like repeat